MIAHYGIVYLVQSVAAASYTRGYKAVIFESYSGYISTLLWAIRLEPDGTRMLADIDYGLSLQDV